MGVSVIHADCRDAIRDMADCSIDSVCTDPPYSLQTINKRFAKVGRNDKTWSRSGPHQRTAAGFMGQKWDTGETAFDPAFWADVLRVLKPGAHLLAFSGTRTYHRLACAIEDAGFEIRDQIGWLYGSGFPKSHNAGDGWGTALKPAWEPIVLARKALIGTVAANRLQHGTGAINVDACRVSGGGGGDREGEASAARRYTERGSTSFSLTPGPRGGAASGRWPANVIHDGSDEVLDAFPEAPGQQRDTGPQYERTGNVYGKFAKVGAHTARGDAGSAARFFYSAKADASDRLGSKHPTVKPVDLMAYLCRLITPPGGIVLDPFAGSGTTGMACLREGFNCVLIEREAAYVADIHRRLQHVEGADTPLFKADPIQPSLLGDAA
jgi:site-specific DNA-methyltransferase (adenine-specific)